MAKAETAKADSAVVAKPSIIARVVPILLVTILAGGGGFLQGTFFRGGSHEPEATKEAESAEAPAEGAVEGEAKEEEAVESKTIVRSLAPIISNLGVPSDTWMRLELSLLLDEKAGAEQDLIAVKAGDSVVAFLRNVEIKKIEGPSGFMHFRQDLSDMLVAEFAGKITGVLIGSMVVE